MHCMVASSIPCKSSPCADRAHACAGDSYVSSGIDVACPTTQSVLAIGSLHELQGDSWPSSSTGTSSFCCNHQYSVTAITTSTGAVAERYAYTAYGQPTILDASASVLSSSAINNRYTYTGREWDATLALYHFRARWMSGLSGRFISRDPIGYAGSSWGLYEFVAGRALSSVDPTGFYSVGGGGMLYVFPGAIKTVAPTGPVSPGKCRITVRCTPLIVVGATHCGIRMEDANGSSEIDIGGSDGKCTFVNGPVGLWPFPTSYKDWWGGEYDSSVCDCIQQTKAKINAENMRYSPTPSNGCSEDNPNCNSNYATKCLLSNCGIALKSTGLSLTDPVGWNFRRQVCTDRYQSTRGRSGCGPCICREWKNIDDDYCGEKPLVTPHATW